jgi:hypothetical protein
MNLGTGGRMTSAKVSGPRNRGSFSRVAQAREKQVYAAVREALVSIRLSALKLPSLDKHALSHIEISHIGFDIQQRCAIQHIDPFHF